MTRTVEMLDASLKCFDLFKTGNTIDNQSRKRTTDAKIFGIVPLHYLSK
tara:strand:- start:244 stop:390 length:147 start_codon:yes stop_codon:yes gene_type:complete